MSGTAREIPRRAAGRPATSAPAPRPPAKGAQGIYVTDPEELDLIRRIRAGRRADESTRADLRNPAVGVALSLRELPRYAVMTLPAIATALGQVGQVVDSILFGVMDADGDTRRLSPSAIVVLLTITAVRLKLLPRHRRIVGTLDAENLALLLGYRPRAMRGALAELEAAALIRVERNKYGQIEQLWLAGALMDLPNRPRRSYPQGRSRWDRLGLARQKFAAPYIQAGALDDNPLPPCEPAAPAAPRAPEPPRPPTTAGEGNAPPRPTAASAPLPVEPILTPAATDSLDEARRTDQRPRHTRQRQHGANDYSRDGVTRGLWRSLLELAGFSGPAPPS